MTAHDLLGYSNCLRQGEDFIKRCGATYTIAIKALEELKKKEDEAIVALKKKEEERLAAEKVKAQMRADLEREAEFQKLLTQAKRKQESAAKFAADADREVNRLLREKDKADAAAKKLVREAGLQHKKKVENQQKHKREKCAITAANGCLKLSLGVVR